MSFNPEGADPGVALPAPINPDNIGLPPVTIDNVQLDGVIEVIESGGMNTISKRTERGFEFSSYINEEPVEAEVECFIETGQYNTITGLRDTEEPVVCSLGDLVLTTAVIDDVEIIQESEIKSHHRANIQVREVKTPGARQVTIVETGSGVSASSVRNDPDFVPPEEEPDESLTNQTTGGDNDGGGSSPGLIEGAIDGAVDAFTQGVGIGF